MPQPLVAGNWKMNGSLDSIRTLLGALKNADFGNAQCVVMAPSIYLPQVAEQLKNSSVSWGAQNVSQHSSGAFTGEISADMLKDFDCRYALVGHSERRSLYGESDMIVAEKFAAIQKAGLIPMLCLGEQLEEREAGVTESVVNRQLQTVIDHVGVAAFAQAVIAYEPVWAIGTGKTATPQQAQEVHHFIRSQLASKDATIAAEIQILYGGSVNAKTAKSLFAMADIDGGLVGGASLKADEFITILHSF